MCTLHFLGQFFLNFPKKLLRKKKRKDAEKQYNFKVSEATRNKIPNSALNVRKFLNVEIIQKCVHFDWWCNCKVLRFCCYSIIHRFLPFLFL